MCVVEVLLEEMHINPDMLESYWPTGGACRLGAHVLSSTAPCRSTDVESMVKVRCEWAYMVWVSLYVYIPVQTNRICNFENSLVAENDAEFRQSLKLKLNSNAFVLVFKALGESSAVFMRAYSFQHNSYDNQFTHHLLHRELHLGSMTDAICCLLCKSPYCTHRAYT